MAEIKIIKGKELLGSHDIVDIILPVYKHPGLTKKCIKSIKEHTINYNIIVIDNSEDNVGVVKAENMGIQASKVDYVLIMGNDTTVSPRWLENMFVPINIDKTIGVVGSIFEKSTNFQTKENYQTNKERWIMIPGPGPINFSCTLIRKEIFTKIGLLDENFYLGFGADDDFCKRAWRAGYKIALNLQNVIQHEGRVTIKEIPNWEEIAQKEKDYLLTKYPGHQ